MPDSRTDSLVQLAQDTARRITGSHTAWMAYLQTVARLYKYPYHEQLLIFAQRPQATACAGYEVWKNTMRRYVRRGAKGIALLDTSGDAPRLRYVFDVADTGEQPEPLETFGGKRAGGFAFAGKRLRRARPRGVGAAAARHLFTACGRLLGGPQAGDLRHR